MPRLLPSLSLLLPTLKSPQQLHELSLVQLRQLAQEIRDELCHLSERRTLHFASNMGVVELAIALHSVFDFRRDRLLWDTGHQVYPHKMLTGRFDQMETIRTRGGLTGFPNPQESEYDLMMTGHAGTSVGTALGLACGDTLLGETDRHSVAVVGDAAFASGLIFEAMGHCGWLRKNMTVVLNDNGMAICPRVGGISIFLDRLRMARTYLGFKNTIRSGVRTLPLVNRFTERFLGSVKSAIKAGFLGGMLFEELGFRYIGPIDGHDIGQLQKFLRLVRSYNEPVLLHVLTEKGRGFRPAEENPTAFHVPEPETISHPPAPAVKPVAARGKNRYFVAETASEPAPPSHAFAAATFTQVAREKLFDVLYHDKKVCVITAAMCQGAMLEPVRARFPDRFFDVGICESHSVNFAAGLARAGMRPVVCLYSTFLQRSYDQVFQEVSLANLPITLLIDRAGIVGADGPTHHGVFDIAALRPFPNLVLMAPSHGEDLEAMIKLATSRDFGRPSVIRYPKAVVPPDVRVWEPLAFGKAETVRKGNDGVVVACGGLLAVPDEAAKELGKNLDGRGRVDLGVINARFVKPLDTETILQPLRDGKFLITIEEGVLAGGFGSAVLEAACDEHLDTRRLYRMGIPDVYVEHGERGELLRDVGLSVENLKIICRKMIGR
ncbi:MAG: 1-deoxy-D-xylulose-5-phosphate synthase [Thermoguttaceae bacterium]